MLDLKIVICTLFLMVVAVSVSAQEPDTAWTRQYNSIENPYGSIDGACSVQQAADNGYILTGYYCGSSSGLWLIKTDEDGDTTWTMVYGWATQDDDVGRCVEQTMDGGYIIAGYIMLWAYNYNKGLLIKTDAYGDTLWTKVIGDSLLSRRFYAVQETADSGYIVLGYMRSTITNNSRIHLWKLDKDGGTIWSELYGNDINTAGYSVQQTIDGGYILTGNMSGALWLAKVDVNGDTVWTKSYSNGARGLSVKQLSGGGYIVAGYRNASGWLLRANENGDTLWTKTFGNRINSVDIVSESGYILGGQLNDDFYIARTDINGDLLWTKTFNGTGLYYDDECLSIARTSDQGYIAAGVIGTTGNSGYSNVYLVKIETDTLVILEQSVYNKEQWFRGTIIYGPFIFPEGKNCKIFDITGREINTLNPVPGIYFIEVDGEIKQKVVKIR